jgi:hypothetical protein
VLSNSVTSESGHGFDSAKGSLTTQYAAVTLRIYSVIKEQKAEQVALLKELRKELDKFDLVLIQSLT